MDGKTIRAGIAVALAAGTTLSFGRAEQAWELTDASPPCPMLVPEDEPERAVPLETDLVALPTPDEPWATVFRWKDGSFRLEKEETLCPLVAGQTFELRGQRWRFSCPSEVSQTSTLDWPELLARGLDGAALCFEVSADEEHVELKVRRGNRLETLGSRQHNYILLYLCRQRVADAASGLDEGSAGWRYRDELFGALKLDRERLNLAIFRIRKHFEAAGFHDAARVIERRPDTQQLRIGVGRLEIEQL